MWFCKIFKIFMAPARLSILKFVGTISLGVLTGISYSLSTFAIPSILSLTPDASYKALSSLTTLAQVNLNRLSRVATGAFLIAYITSPVAVRHPYLLYTSLFAGAAGASSLISPALLGETAIPVRQKKTPIKNLEASYDDLGSSITMVDETSEVNGEEVRALAENYTKARVIETCFSSVAFLTAVLGIWGDSTTLV